MSAIEGKLGVWGTALQAAIGIGGRLRNAAESGLAENRPLVAYSGKIATGLAQLELGDQLRSLRLARPSEEGAVRLAGVVNSLRDSAAGIQ
jgi:hypothetical protein